MRTLVLLAIPLAAILLSAHTQLRALRMEVDVKDPGSIERKLLAQKHSIEIDLLMLVQLVLFLLSEALR